MPENLSKIRRAASSAARTTAVFASPAILLILVQVTLYRALGDEWAFNWRTAAAFFATIGAVLFCVQFAFALSNLNAAAPAEAILAEVRPGSAAKTGFSGFVAMEYYALILNRTFVVFIAPDALYGWKVCGPVTNLQPKYFLPYEKIITDPALMHNREAVQKLSELKGGFAIPRSQIMGVELIRGKKWGMGGVPHTGRIHLRLASGSTREFILLGDVDGERVQREILAGAAVLH